MAKPKPIIGIDLGGTNMQIGVVDAEGAVIGRSRKKTQALEGRAKVIERIVEGVNAACELAGVTVKQTAGLGIGAPGAIDPHRGVVLEAVNLRWNDVPLADILTDKLGIPVIVDNDVNVAVYGEWKMGAGRGAADILGVWIARGSAGGSSSTTASMKEPSSPPGRSGTPSSTPTRRWARAPSKRTVPAPRSPTGSSSSSRPTTPPSSPTPSSPGSRSKSKLIADAYESGDDLTRKVVDEVAALVGVAVANAVTLLSLPRVILGGGLTEAIGKPFVTEVKKSVKLHVFPDRCRQVEIVASELEDDAGVIGAALLARQKLS